MKLKKHLLPLLIFVMLLLSALPMFVPGVSAVSVDSSIVFECSSGNRHYTFSHNMMFSSISVEPYWVTFNTSRFIFYPVIHGIVTLAFLDDNPLAATTGDKIFEFNYSTAGSILFEIGGLKNSQPYRIMRGNVNWSYPTSDSGGYVSFISTLTGTDINIKIYEYSVPPPDTTKPTITLNFAGNHSEKGGPYWNPTIGNGETTMLVHMVIVTLLNTLP